MDLSAYGYGIMGPGDSPVENNNGATDDGTSLGYLQTGCKETMTFTSDKAVQVELGVTMAYNAETALEGVITVKFNGAEISMANRSCEGPEDGNNQNYYDFHAVSFGMVNLIAGNNVLEIEVLGQVAPNMDKVVIWTDQTLQIKSVPAPQKEAIVVTPTEKEIEVGEEFQITTATAGVTYASSSEAVATVSATGLVKGVAIGKATITVSKEGMKKASVVVTVKAKPVAGQIVLEAEDAVLPEGTSIQLENGDNCSGGKSLGYFSAEQTFEIKFNATEAKTYKLSMVASSAAIKSDWSGFDEMTLTNEVMTMKFNDVVVDLGTQTLPGSSGWTKTWKEIDLGNVTTKVGENVFSFAAISQGPNIDCLKLTDPNATPEPPVEEKVTVSFDVNGGTGEMASVQVVKGSEYTLPGNGFTAPTGKVFGGWDITTGSGWQAQTKNYEAGAKVTISADTVIKAHWSYEQSTPVDLSSAYYAEAENAELAGGAKVENNTSAHGEKSVGYMNAGASITFNFRASAAGKATLILLAASASANWMSNPVQYYDHDIASTTTMTVNGVAVDLTGKGVNGNTAPAFTQVNLGEFDLIEGNNTVVINATAQSVNVDAIAVVSSLTISDPLPPVGLVFAELESATFERAEGQTVEDTLTVIDQADAHDGKAVTNFKKGSKVTIRFNASAAGKVGLKLIASSSAGMEWNGTYYMQTQQLSSVMSMKLNTADLDLTGKTIGSQYAQTRYEWSVVDFGEIDVQLGENVIVLEATGDVGPNLDALRIQGSETLTVTVL